ncbi:MAG: hypothetical protein NVS2B11_06440 [Acetobacteraceae bacterium]
MRVLLALLVLALALGGGAWYALDRFDAPGPLAAKTAVLVPRGGIDPVAAALERDGVVGRAWQLEAAALVTRARGGIHAGELEFPAGASLRHVLEVLRSGHPIQHRLTIAEGLTAAQIAILVDRATAVEGETPMVAEGSLLPETYAYERGNTRAALLERAAREMTKAVDQAWSTRAPDLPLANPQEMLTLASIVERETAKPEERPRVAAVFLNRLRRGMKLQSDPTVVYGVSGGAGVLDHGLTRAELDADTPYNTYRIAGLPPGPICMPGGSSLKAVAQPAPGDELYFVADGTGGHVFARTEQEHLRNVSRWREVERVRARPPQ